VLRKIGVATHYTKLGNLVVKLSLVPQRLYIPVFTYSMRRIGVLYDVIGPVDEPYGLVKPLARDDSVLGQPLYTTSTRLENRGRKH